MFFSGLRSEILLSYISICSKAGRDAKTEISEMESLYKQLIFTLKYEGVNLLLFKKLTQYYDVNQLNQLVDFEPTGQDT